VKLSVTPSCFGGLQAADSAALALADADSLGAGSLADGASELGAADVAPPPPELQPTTIAVVARNAKMVRERMLKTLLLGEVRATLASSSTRTAAS